MIGEVVQVQVKANKLLQPNHRSHRPSLNLPTLSNQVPKKRKRRIKHQPRAIATHSQAVEIRTTIREALEVLELAQVERKINLFLNKVLRG